MAFCNLKLVVPPFLPPMGETDLPIKNHPVFQGVKSKGQKLQALGVTRRDTMLFLTAETANILLTEPAEARVGRLEMKKKIMEKLEKLRERGRPSKSKTENAKTASSTQPPYTANKLQSLAPSIPFPNPQEDPIGALVENIVP